MRQILFFFIVILLAGCRAIPREYDQGGKLITRDREGRRIYDADATPEWNNPHGIAPPDPRSGITVQVPGPPVWKAVEDLTPEDRASLAAKEAR